MTEVPSNSSPPRPPAGLNAPLSRLQAVIGFITGLLSIFATIVSHPQLFHPQFSQSTPVTGEVVAVVQNAKSAKAVSDATIEILTPQDALVATLTPDPLGLARHTVPGGSYRVRVSHPRFGSVLQQIQVLPGQTAEVRVQLRDADPSPPARAKGAVKQGIPDLRRILGP